MPHSKFQLFSSKDRDTTAISLIPNLNQDLQRLSAQYKNQFNASLCGNKSVLGCILGCFWVSAARDM